MNQVGTLEKELFDKKKLHSSQSQTLTFGPNREIAKRIYFHEVQKEFKGKKTPGPG